MTNLSSLLQAIAAKIKGRKNKGGLNFVKKRREEKKEKKEKVKNT